MSAFPQGHNDRIDIAFEQLRIIYAAVPLSLAAVIIGSAILSFTLWGTVAAAHNLAWLSAILLVSVFRWMVYRRFNQQPEADQQHPRWHQLALAGSLLSGVTWGSTAILLFPEHSMPHQLFLAFVIAGMSAGAVTTLSAISSMAIGFLLLTLLPLTVRFTFADSGMGHAMALMTAVFSVMIVTSSLRLHRIILESLQIRYERQQAEHTIRHQALYDELTDLPNRRLLLEMLKQEMARSERHDHLSAVLFLDLDRFKTINDSLGHRIGDRLLLQVGQRLRGRLREEDTAARLGGDEFVVLIPEVGDQATIASVNTLHIAEDVLRLFEQPFNIDGHELHLSASMGIALFPMGQQDPEDLLQQADVAMYIAKERGRATSQMFLPSMQATVDERLQIERGLRHALKHGQLELHYQPQVRQHGEMVGAEALARWHHPELGNIPPSQFIAVAEETGLIYQLGDWILRRACEDLASLGAQSPLRISVNISPRQFRENSFIDRVATIIQQTGAPPDRLTLEITEGVVIDNIEQTIERMQTLKAMGVSFSVDDFGTGHSSLAYLKRLPLDVLKIDQSFVRDITTDPNDAVIVETIIVMSRHLGLDVIAEGVETEQALAFLERHGCRCYQGYLFGRPEPFASLLKRLEDAATPRSPQKTG